MNKTPITFFTFILFNLFIFPCWAEETESKPSIPFHSQSTLLSILPTPKDDTGIFFSPDGQKVAYSLKEGEKSVALINGKKGKFYDDINLYSFKFSKDGNSLAYKAQVGK